MWALLVTVLTDEHVTVLERKRKILSPSQGRTTSLRINLDLSEEAQRPR